MSTTRKASVNDTKCVDKFIGGLANGSERRGREVSASNCDCVNETLRCGDCSYRDPLLLEYATSLPEQKQK